ncbi:MAG: hypothetical protein ABI321_01840 [Polyangia bacterium]
MRTLYAVVFLFAASGSAHAGWFGSSKKPTEQQKANNAARMHSAVEGHAQRSTANEKLIAHESQVDPTVERLATSLQDLHELSQKSGWRAMNRSVSVYRDAVSEAEHAVTNMNKATSPGERTMYFERGRAAHAIARQAVQIRQSLGQHGPRLEPGSERWRMGEIEKALNMNIEDAHHMSLMHHEQFGSGNVLFNGLNNRTAFQPSVLAATAPPPPQ